MKNLQTAVPAWSDLLSGSNGWRALGLAGGVALHATNVYVATTILPSVVHGIGGLDLYAWNTTLFVVASILGSVLSVRLLSALGARTAYFTALVVFAAGTVVCASAPAMSWMLAGRTLQGFGGGILLALSYALIRVVFEERLWSRAMGLVSGMWGVATLCGPALGGVFAEMGDWRLAFWVLLPVIAMLAAIVWREVENSRPDDDTSQQIPYLKVALLAASVLVISLASLFDDLRWNVLGVCAGVGFAWLLARLERVPRDGGTRLLPTGAYSIRTGLGGIYACMSLLGIGVTSEIFVPYFLQTIHGRSPLAAGYLTALMAAGWSVSAMLSAGRSGVAADRLICVGPVVEALGLAGLAWLVPSAGLFDDVAGTTALCVALASAGFGIGISWPHLLTRVFTAAEPGEAHLASLSITTIQLFAIAFGSALAGLIANGAGLTSLAPLAGAQQTAVWLFGVFAVARGGSCRPHRTQGGTGMIDRVQAMRIFVRIVDASSFTRAAESLDIPRATASTTVQSLELLLGVQLLVRTTRRVTLTAEGAAYYERCAQILAAIDEVESGLFNRPENLRGRLRVEMPGTIAASIVVPALAGFHARHPHIELAVGVSNRAIDLVGENVDCSIELGELPDSGLVARRLGMLERVTCASPDYLARHGMPETLDDLSGHFAVNWLSTQTGRRLDFDFDVDFARRPAKVKVDGFVQVNDEHAYLACGIEGLGLIQPGRAAAAPYLASGQLIEVLPSCRPTPVVVSVAYVRNRQISPRVRAFVDWLAELFEHAPGVMQPRPAAQPHTPWPVIDSTQDRSASLAASS
jgi:DNA-binding transcriptional LysR family regulator/MFS family permease